MQPLDMFLLHIVSEGIRPGMTSGLVTTPHLKFHARSICKQDPGGGCLLVHKANEQDSLSMPDKYFMHLYFADHELLIKIFFCSFLSVVQAKANAIKCLSTVHKKVSLKQPENLQLGVASERGGFL